MRDINIHFRHYEDETKTKKDHQNDETLRKDVNVYYGTAYVEVKKLNSFNNSLLVDEIVAEICSNCIEANTSDTIKDTLPQMAKQIERYYVKYGLKVKSISLSHKVESYWKSNGYLAFSNIKEQANWQSEDTSANTSNGTAATADGKEPGSIK